MLLNNHFSAFIFLSAILSLGACGGGGGSGSGENTDDVDVSTFDGVWFGPCFNNLYDFSARQKITINGTSLISQLESHANAPAQTPNCGLSAGQFIVADITATLGYGSNSQESSCVDNTGVDSSITLVSNETSGVLINTQPGLIKSIELLTGRKDDFLPASSVICLKPNGSLLFAGHEYTSTKNTTIVDEITDDTTTVVTPSVIARKSR